MDTRAHQPTALEWNDVKPFAINATRYYASWAHTIGESTGVHVNLMLVDPRYLSYLELR